MSEFIKSYVVKHGNKKVQIAYKSHDMFLQRCKQNFDIDDHTQFEFLRSDSEIHVDIESIESLQNETELQLSCKDYDKENILDKETCNVGCEDDDKESIFITETFEVGGKVSLSSSKTERKTYHDKDNISGTKSSEVRDKVLALIHWHDKKQSILILVGILALLYYLSNNSFLTVIFHIHFAISIVALVMRCYFLFMSKIKKINKLELKKSTQPYCDILSQAWHSVVLEIEIGVNTIYREMYKTVLPDEVADVNALKRCFGICLFAYVGTFFQVTTLLTIVTLAAFIFPSIYVANQSQIDRFAQRLWGSSKVVIRIMKED